MEIKKYHIELRFIDADGNVYILYPEAKAIDIVPNKRNSNLPANILTLQDIIDKFGALAFEGNDEDIPRLEVTEDDDSTILDRIIEANASEISDTAARDDRTWSSKQVKALFDELYTRIQNGTLASGTNLSPSYPS